LVTASAAGESRRRRSTGGRFPVSIATAAAALIMERALIGSTVTQIRCCARGEDVRAG
jgi:hypothetical protein